MVEQLSKNITRQGLTNYTLNFLRVSYKYDNPFRVSERHIFQVSIQGVIIE